MTRLPWPACLLAALLAVGLVLGLGGVGRAARADLSGTLVWGDQRGRVVATDVDGRVLRRLRVHREADVTRALLIDVERRSSRVLPAPRGRFELLAGRLR
jgi:hypothetical protein